MTDLTDSKTWKEELKQVWPYATAVTLLLFSTASVTAWFVTWQAGASNLLGYVLAVVDPALAALMMVLTCIIRPAVFSGRAFAFPHMFTMPTLYMAVIYGFKLLGRDAATVRRYESVERFDLIWLDTRLVLVVWIGMIIVLSAIGTFQSKPDSERP